MRLNRYDARKQYIDGLERYVSGIETDGGLLRLASNVSAYHDRMPAEGLPPREGDPRSPRGFFGSYAAVAEGAT